MCFLYIFQTLFPSLLSVNSVYVFLYQIKTCFCLRRFSTKLRNTFKDILEHFLVSLVVLLINCFLLSSCCRLLHFVLHSKASFLSCICVLVMYNVSFIKKYIDFYLFFIDIFVLALMLYCLSYYNYVIYLNHSEIIQPKPTTITTCKPLFFVH